MKPPADAGLPSKKPHVLVVAATEPDPDGGTLVVNVEVVRRGNASWGLLPYRLFPFATAGGLETSFPFGLGSSGAWL